MLAARPMCCSSLRMRTIWPTICSKPRPRPSRPWAPCANWIIRDGGVGGTVMCLGRGFCEIEQVDSATLRVGAGALNGTLAAAAAEAGIGGLAFLIGIPGTIGGALRMNAGAYGTEMREVVASVTALDRQGTERTLTPGEMGFAYRATSAPEGLIFTGAVVRGQAHPPADIWAEMEAIKQRRLASQPIRERTGGSTFANPSACGASARRWACPPGHPGLGGRGARGRPAPAHRRGADVRTARQFYGQHRHRDGGRSGGPGRGNPPAGAGGAGPRFAVWRLSGSGGGRTQGRDQLVEHNSGFQQPRMCPVASGQVAVSSHAARRPRPRARDTIPAAMSQGCRLRSQNPSTRPAAT